MPAWRAGATVWLLVGLLLAGLGILANDSRADGLWPEEEQRMRVGLQIFPAVLGAVEDLKSYCLPDGALAVLVVYEGAAASAREASEGIDAIGRIRGLPVVSRSLTAAALDALGDQPVGGIFVASAGLSPQRLRAWSERYRTLVFSPFEGDVESGAVAGLWVTDQILPFVNPAQAARAGIRFKPFFLKVARTHD